MAIKIKQAAPKWTELEKEPYFGKLVTRAQRLIKTDSHKAERAFFGFADGLIKGSTFSTSDLRINRQIRHLVQLVQKSIDTGKLDPTLETLFHENQLPESDDV